MKIFPAEATILLCTVATVFLMGCATPELTVEQNLQLDQAMTSEDPSGLTGRLRFLYDKRIEELRVRDAVSKGQGKTLKGRQKIQYEASLEKQREIEATRHSEALEREKAEKLAAAQRAEQARLKIVEIEQAKQRARVLEQQRLQAQELATLRKIEEPVHAQWPQEMQDLNLYFQNNGFEPANRLVDVYARTMQFLIHTNPSEAQFTAFYNTFSDTEKLEHRRLFHNQTGTELIAAFWEQRDPANKNQP